MLASIICKEQRLKKTKRDHVMTKKKKKGWRMMDGETREMKRERWWPGSERGQRSGALREIVPNLSTEEERHGGNRENTGGQRKLREY